MAHESLRIGLRALGGEQWLGGVYYIFNLIRALQALPDDERPAIFLILSQGADRAAYAEIEQLVERVVLIEPQDRSAVAALGRRIARVGDRLTGLATGRVMEQPVIDSALRPLVRALQREKVSLLFPCTDTMGTGFPVPWLGWVWDLQHRHYPELFSEEELRWRDKMFASQAADAPLIVLSSHAAREEFARWFPESGPKLRVLSFTTTPSPEWYEGDSGAAAGRYNLPARYFMVANQFWVHKNHRVVFEALKILTDRGVAVHVVCTGHRHDYRRPEHYDRLVGYLRDHNLAGRVSLLGVVPRHDQIQLFRKAVAVIQPSLFEGWSTVVEDARALGKRMVLSDIPVHREQAPPRSVYFDPSNAGALADRMMSEWKTAQAGPVADDEQEARAAQRQRVTDFGRRFVQLAAESHRQWAAAHASFPANGPAVEQR